MMADLTCLSTTATWRCRDTAPLNKVSASSSASVAAPKGLRRFTSNPRKGARHKLKAKGNNQKNIMKLSFKRTVALKRGYYLAGTEHDIADRHAAELYVARGDAVVVGEQPSN